MVKAPCFDRSFARTLTKSTRDKPTDEYFSSRECALKTLDGYEQSGRLDCVVEVERFS